MSVGSRSRSLFPNPTSSSPEGKDPGYIFPQSPLPPLLSSCLSLYPSVSSVIPLSFSSGWLSPPSNHYDLLLPPLPFSQLPSHLLHLHPFPCFSIFLPSGLEPVLPDLTLASLEPTQSVAKTPDCPKGTGPSLSLIPTLAYKPPRAWHWKRELWHNHPWTPG